MIRRVSTMLLMATAAGAMSLSPSPAREAPGTKSSEALAKALQGRVGGQAVSCIPNPRGNIRMQVIDDRTILFGDGNTVYLQKPRSECNGVADARYTMVNHRAGNQQLCSGDIQQLVDLDSGFQGGTCVFDEFVPYTKAR